MGLVTLAQLRSRVREAADLEASAGFISEAQLTGIINRACWALDSQLHRTWEDYFCTTLEVTLSGTSYALPADFYKLLFLDVRGSDSQWRPLGQYKLAERNLLRNATEKRVECNRYRILGKTLTLLPGLTAPTPAVLAYYPQVAPLVLETDTRDYPNGWEEWAVLWGALVCLVKEERDTTGLEKLLAREQERIALDAPDRDAEPMGPVDVEAQQWGEGIASWRRG
jgi:hypothetical protein